MRFPVRLAATILKFINWLIEKFIADNKYDVIMIRCGAEKIKVIYEVRQITGFGLAEAKHAVENCPFKVKSGIFKNEAEAIKKKLTAVGATVEIK